MDLALHFPSLIKQGFTKANHLHVRDSLTPSSGQGFSRTAFDGDRRSWPGDKARSSSSSTGRSKKVSVVCCKSLSDEQSSDPSKSKQEEIIALLSRIQASISKGESQGADERNSNESSGNESLSKAILDVLEKPREKTEGDAGGRKEPPKRQVARPPSSFAKRSPTRPSPASDPRGKLPITKSSKALEVTEKEEKPPLIETMKLAELKEVAKSRGLKGYSKLKKSEILELLRSS